MTGATSRAATARGSGVARLGRSDRTAVGRWFWEIDRLLLDVEGAAEREWAKRRKGYRDSHWGGAALTDAEVDAKLRENDAFWGRSTTPKPKG